MALFWTNAVQVIEQPLLIPHSYQTDTRGALVLSGRKNTLY